MANLAEELRALEVQVMTAAGAGRADEVAGFVAEDFFEIGMSGKSYNRAEMLAALRDMPRRKFTLEGFQVGEVAADVALISYRTREVAKKGIVWAHRSTLWVRRAGKWQIVFHQATPAAA
jgi:glyoxylase I family protein